MSGYHDEGPPLFVAVFREHPLGPRRFVKDLKHTLSEYAAPWWFKGTEEDRVEHFAWALHHEQYHYSCADIRNADLWNMDSADAIQRAILDKYAPVTFIEVVFAYSDKDEHGWQSYWIEEKPVG